MSNREYTRAVIAKQFTAICDGMNQAQIVEQMAEIVQQLEISGVKTVSVIGGAASGKSTIAEELIRYLQKAGTASDILSTDNYAVGDRQYRQVDLKDADAQKKYDFKLMDEHIRSVRQLTDDKTVDVPVIDTKTGIAADQPEDNYAHEISKIKVLVIEGDFPRDDYDIRFYIHVPDAQRLEKNIEREVERNDDIDPSKLTETFNDRQRTIHKPYTLPALQSADYILVADVSSDDWLYTMYQRSK